MCLPGRSFSSLPRSRSATARETMSRLVAPRNLDEVLSVREEDIRIVVNI
jgi:hypothetical protein